MSNHIESKWSDLPQRQTYDHATWQPIPGQYVNEVQERCSEIITYGCTLCGALVDNIDTHTKWHIKQGE